MGESKEKNTTMIVRKDAQHTYSPNIQAYHLIETYQASEGMEGKRFLIKT